MAKIITILVHIEERNGEQEYTFHLMTGCREGNETKAADQMARTWYDGRAEQSRNEYYHLNGQVAVSVKSWQRVKPEHILILNKYGIY